MGVRQRQEAISHLHVVWSLIYSLILASQLGSLSVALMMLPLCNPALRSDMAEARDGRNYVQKKKKQDREIERKLGLAGRLVVRALGQ